jgi:PucR family transcriptional regulator, purine catabolism regulatory protein
VSRAEREVVEAQTAFTVADALALPVMQEGTPEVLAGEVNLGRPIRWVHSGEFPDMPAVLKGGELLLTHGMSIGGGEERQRHYIGDLARAGLAGLVIELGASMRGVPGAVVDEARRHRLPLIVLHRPIPWIEVTEAVHRTIVSRQAALLERGQQLQDQFAALLAAGAGVAEVLRALADLVRNPIVLSREGEILYSAPRDHQHAALASAWEAASRGLPQAPATVTVPVDVAGDAHWGLAVVIALERPLDPFDRVAMERAVPILALAFLRAHEAETLAAQHRGEFLDALLDEDGRLSAREAYRRATAIGFERRTSWLVPLAVDLALGFGRLDERRWALAGRDVRRELASRRTPAVVGTLGRQRHLAAIAGLDAPDQRPALAQALTDAVRRAVQRALPDAAVVVCIGRSSPSWREAGEALRETVEALPTMRHAPARPWHDVAGPDLRRLLWPLLGERHVAEFVKRRLAPLEAHDAHARGDLVHTLEVFCAHSGRKAETARALHLERQSLYKRLTRIETLLEADLDDEDTRLGLHLALRARRLMAEAASPGQTLVRSGSD